MPQKFGSIRTDRWFPYARCRQGVEQASFPARVGRNYEGSLYYAKKSAWIMESLNVEFSRPEAHDMRLQAGCVLSALFVRHAQIGGQNG